MRVREIMTREVDTAAPDDTLQSAAEKMARDDVGSLPVCEGRRVVGIITDRDMVVRALAHGGDGQTRVRDVMTKGVESVREEDDLEDVNDRMSAAQVRRLPVVNDHDELIGIVALADVARRDEARESGATLSEISERGVGEGRTF